MEANEALDAAKLIGMRLLARRSAYAVHCTDEQGRWVYARKTKDMKLDLLQQHLNGGVGIGHYLIQPTPFVDADDVEHSSFTRMFAFDIDPDKGEPRDKAMEGDPEIWRDMIRLGHGLSQLAKRITGSFSMVSYGGAKGLHVLCPLRRKINPTEAKSLGEGILWNHGFETYKGDNFWKSDEWPDLTVEIFPKQTHVEEGGFGNLMRLPLGVNSKTGREAYFIPLEAEALGHMDDPIATLTSGTIR